MKMPTREEMRVEFHRLKAAFEAGQDQLKAKQEAYEAKRVELMEREERELKPLADELKTAREALGLHEMQQQMAMLNRAIGGETGAPPAGDGDAETAAAA